MTTGEAVSFIVYPMLGAVAVAFTFMAGDRPIDRATRAFVVCLFAISLALSVVKAVQ